MLNQLKILQDFSMWNNAKMRLDKRAEVSDINYKITNLQLEKALAGNPQLLAREKEKLKGINKTENIILDTYSKKIDSRLSEVKPQAESAAQQIFSLIQAEQKPQIPDSLARSFAERPATFINDGKVNRTINNSNVWSSVTTNEDQEPHTEIITPVETESFTETIPESDFPISYMIIDPVSEFTTETMTDVGEIEEQNTIDNLRDFSKQEESKKIAPSGIEMPFNNTEEAVEYGGKIKGDKKLIDELISGSEEAKKQYELLKSNPKRTKEEMQKMIDYAVRRQLFNEALDGAGELKKENQ